MKSRFIMPTRGAIKMLPASENDEKKLADDFLKAVLTQTVVGENELADYLPAYANQAIHFATDDMGSDKAMGGVLLDILIVTLPLFSL